MGSPPVHFSLDLRLLLSSPLVLVANGEHLMSIQQVGQRVCTIPQFVLPPHSVSNRREQVCIVIYWFCDDPVRARNWLKAEFFPPKKSEAPHLIASMHRRIVSAMSYSTSSTP